MSELQKEAARKTGLANRGRSMNRAESHGLWKGDAVGRDALHSWVIKRLGKPTKCEHCGNTEKRTEWANKSQEYKRDLGDWLRLCRSCHLKYDNLMGVRNGNRKATA